MSNRSRPLVHRHVAALAAVVALLGQVFFPHVHASNAPRAALAAGTRSAALARCTAECPTVVASATTPDADGDTDRHSSSSCPLCRAQSDARSSLLPSSLAVPLPVALRADLPLDTVASLVTAVRSLASPRAPPLAS